MKIKLPVFWITYAAAIALVFGLNFWLKRPESGLAAAGLGIFILMARREYGAMTQRASIAAAVIAVCVMFLPLKQLSLQLAIGIVLIFCAVYFFTDSFSFYLKELTGAEKKLNSRRNELKEDKESHLAAAKAEDDSIEKEIKDIRSLYDAAKELGSSLNHSETMERTSEVLKKILKNNFKIPLEDINFLIIFKKDYEYKIVQSFGYDEEQLKENEKVFVNSVLKMGGKNQHHLYVPDMGKFPSESGQVMAMNKSVIYIPFFAEKKLLGVLFISGARTNMFDSKQVDSIRILSNQIALSLEKVHLYEEVEKLSETDSLTGLYVHRFFQEKLENEIKRTARYGGKLALVLGDIDHFKTVNDTYGHLAGDYILKTIAILLKNHTNPVDTVARYGGEEFVIVLPDHDKERAHAKAVKIRKEIEKYPFKYQDIAIKITMSMGVAEYPGDSIARRSLIDKADKALYRAKEEGRNRVIRA